MRNAAMDWRTAYWEQAKSDYAMLLKLIREDAPLCHRLHYLQMATEKLAKGFLTEPGGPRYPKTHDAFVSFVRLSGRQPSLRRALRFTRISQTSGYVNSIAALAQQVENLSPEGADHPNPEYPWEVRGVIIAPADYNFAALRFENPKMVKLLQFVDNCFALI